MIGLVAVSFLSLLPVDEGPLTIADLASYRAALAPSSQPAQPVTFRALWDHPDVYRGRCVSVSGRVMSVFHNPPVGEFPALAEVWIFSGASDPFCLVCPETPASPAPKPGASVTFTGTYLRQITYHGSDVDRLAPLIVGSEPPRAETPVRLMPGAATQSPFDGVFVLILALFVVAAILRVHLRRPRQPVDLDPPPTFI